MKKVWEAGFSWKRGEFNWEFAIQHWGYRRPEQKKCLTMLNAKFERSNKIQQNPAPFNMVFKQL